MSTIVHTTPKTVQIVTQKVDLQAEFQALVDGITTLMPSVDPFMLAKLSIPRTQLLAQFQARIDAAKQTKVDRLALASSVARERELDAQVMPLRAQFKLYAQGRYGKNAPELQQFGLVQNRKPRKPAATKAAGVQKAKATRTARGTAGRQQKAAITGAAPAAAITPPLTASPPSAAAPPPQTVAPAVPVVTPAGAPPAVHS